MVSRRDKLLLMKIVSLFSVVRGYNIPIIILAQYLSAIFILAPDTSAVEILLDWRLFIIVFASSLTIASGYIINNFYDSQKDLINRPRKSMLDRLVSQHTKLYVYFGINFIVFFMALLVSWRAAIFFSGYIFSHATFLYLLLLIREMVKDLENLSGDFVSNYRTVPVVFGERKSKEIITVLSLCTIIPLYLLIEVFEIGYMDIYFYCSAIVLLFLLIKLWNSASKPDYLRLHNALKILVVAGVFCIVLIDPAVLIHGRKMLLQLSI